ncbi:hypothetical protein PAHAL_1G186100 [Panicum hallii]|uniref:Cytochrome P450 n=2 Tax=Panicum hallii TaxID=206008 RepID=A0A2T8KVU0_9POAL|nr:hypothetical protein PAHAL_1G186100 [Panicum hallii]
MEHFFGLPHLYCYGVCLLALLLARVLFRACNKPGPRLPPGPWQLPVIGSLHHLLLRRGLPHHTMRHLSLRHGPLMLLRICERAAVVVSSAEAAREVFKGNDAVFSQRPGSPGIDELSRHGQGVIFAPYGDHWRLLRRILMTELLSARRVEAFRHIREDEAARLVASLAASCTPRGQAPVDVDERLREFIADSSVRAILGDRLRNRAAFLRMIKEGQDPSALFDLRDLFPSSRLVRMLPCGGKAERHRLEMFRLMEDVLLNHRERTTTDDQDRAGEQDNMADVLLRIQNEGDMRVSLNHGVIRAVLTDVVGAALDTSSTTLQWAMAELIANPRVMQKAQLEVRSVLAGQRRVREAALSDLHYLKAVIKETLRLHPPAPFVPRVCLDDCKIQGYDVPQGTIAITNVWAISRDPKYWEDPDMFRPERFESGHGFDYKGFDFQFTPFGVGRRMCPGINFSHANVEIALASLLYHFDWKLPNGGKPEEMDMTEVWGVTVTRKAKLFLHPIPCIPLEDEYEFMGKEHVNPSENLLLRI